MASNTEIRKLLLELASAWPDRKLSPGGIDVYCDVLKDLDIEVLQIAKREILATKRFFPSIAEIREAAMSLGVKISGELTAQEAWEDVQLGIREYGSYQRPEFKSALVSRAVEAVGGWFHICTECDIEIMRAQFLKMYDQLLRRKQEDERLLPETREYLGIENGDHTGILPVRKIIGGVMAKMSVEKTGGDNASTGE